MESNYHIEYLPGSAGDFLKACIWLLFTDRDNYDYWQDIFTITDKGKCWANDRIVSNLYIEPRGVTWFGPSDMMLSPIYNLVDEKIDVFDSYLEKLQKVYLCEDNVHIGGIKNECVITASHQGCYYFTDFTEIYYDFIESNFGEDAVMFIGLNNIEDYFISRRNVDSKSNKGFDPNFDFMYYISTALTSFRKMRNRSYIEFDFKTIMTLDAVRLAKYISKKLDTVVNVNEEYMGFVKEYRKYNNYHMVHDTVKGYVTDFLIDIERIDYMDNNKIERFHEDGKP